MFELSAEDQWTTLSDAGDTKGAPSSFVDHTHQQLQQLERMYGYPQALQSTDMDLDPVSSDPQSSVDAPLLSAGFLGHYSAKWDTYVSDVPSTVTSMTDIHSPWTGPEISYLTPRTHHAVLAPPPPYPSQEDPSSWHGSWSPSSPTCSPSSALTVPGGHHHDQIVSRMIIAQSYAAFAHNSTHLSNLQLLHQLPAPSPLPMLQTTATAMLSPSMPSPSCLMASSASSATPVSLLPTSSPATSTSMAHLPPSSPLTTLDLPIATTGLSPLLSSTASCYTPSPSPCLPPSAVLMRSFTAPSVRLSSSSSSCSQLPFLSSGTNNQSISQPNSRPSTPARSRSMHDSAYRSATSTSTSMDEHTSPNPGLGGTTKSPRPATAHMCPVCLKSYANNSTLRRHLKIHAYACSAAVAAVSASSSSSTPVAGSPSMESGLPQLQPQLQRSSSPLLHPRPSSPSPSPSPSLASLPSLADLEVKPKAACDGTCSGPCNALNQSCVHACSSSSSSGPTADSNNNNSSGSIPAPSLPTLASSSRAPVQPLHPSSLSSPAPSTPCSSSSSSSPSSFVLSMPALATTSALLSSSILQYRPGIDTDYRKPECVGCNKAFARRDTVILHIKNIRRKWEIHWREQKLTTQSMAAAAAAAAAATAAAATAVTGMPTLGRLKQEPEYGGINEDVVGYGYDDDNEGDEEEEEDEDRVKQDEDDEEEEEAAQVHSSRAAGRRRAGHYRRKSGSRSIIKQGTMTTVTMAAGGMGRTMPHTLMLPTAAAVAAAAAAAAAGGGGGGASGSGPVALTKEEQSELLRALTEVSPCYRERKVRMFGSFGMVEEPVLQD